MPPSRFEPIIPASEQPQTNALDCAVTGTGQFVLTQFRKWQRRKLTNVPSFAEICGHKEKLPLHSQLNVDYVWNVMAYAQKPDFVFLRTGGVHLNRRGRQLSRLLAVEVCASAVVMLDTPCSEIVWRARTTHSIRQFPLHFPCASPCIITFELDSTMEEQQLAQWPDRKALHSLINKRDITQFLPVSIRATIIVYETEIHLFCGRPAFIKRYLLCVGVVYLTNSWRWHQGPW